MPIDFVTMNQVVDVLRRSGYGDEAARVVRDVLAVATRRTTNFPLVVTLAAEFTRAELYDIAKVAAGREEGCWQQRAAAAVAAGAPR